jgi:hypothetical protein
VLCCGVTVNRWVPDELGLSVWELGTRERKQQVKRLCGGSCWCEVDCLSYRCLCEFTIRKGMLCVKGRPSE